MYTTTKRSSESADTRANRFQRRSERERSPCASKTAKEREERLRKCRMSQADYSDCRAETGDACHRGSAPFKARDILQRLKSREWQGYRCVPVNTRDVLLRLKSRVGYRGCITVKIHRLGMHNVYICNILTLARHG